jgi:hypothetical protein
VVAKNTKIDLKKGTRNSDGEQSEHKFGVILLTGSAPLFVINGICECEIFCRRTNEMIDVSRISLQALCAKSD